MKKYLGFIVVAGLLFSFSVATLARAEDNEGENRDRSEFKQEMENRREEFGKRREEFKDRIEAARKAFRENLQKNRDSFMAELRAKREEFRLANAERKMAFWANAKRMIGERFQAAINHIEKVQVRVGDAIDKLEAEGEDTSAAVESLDSSKANLAAAKVKVEQIKDLIPDNGEKITPEIFEKIKLLAREAKDLLKESKEDLREAVKEIKELMEKDNDGDNDEDGD